VDYGYSRTITFCQGCEFANPPHSGLVALLLTHHGTRFIYSVPLTNFFFEPHVLINGASSGSADKAGHLTHSFKAYSLRKRTTNILINHTPQIFAATTTQPQLNGEPSPCPPSPLCIGRNLFFAIRLVVLTCALEPNLEFRFTTLPKYGILNAKGEMTIAISLCSFKYILGFYLRLK
jgi:hypothetical protein